MVKYFTLKKMGMPEANMAGHFGKFNNLECSGYVWYCLPLFKCFVFFTVSIDRSRRAFDDKELALLNGVRQLRQRLAVENRNKKPPRISAN